MYSCLGWYENLKYFWASWSNSKKMHFHYAQLLSFIVLFTILTAAMLSIWVGVGGWRCFISCNMSQIARASWVLTNNAPNSASAVDATTSFNIVHVMWTLLLRKIGSPFCGTLPKENYAPALDHALLAERYDALRWIFRIISDAWNQITAFGLEYI